MKKLLILSGKGGTGKTTTTAAFLHFAQAKAFADCDVDAPNLHIITQMQAQPISTAFYGMEKCEIDANLCIGCGKCIEVCRFGAIAQENGKYRVRDYGCEGCGVCMALCPAHAISDAPDISGHLALYQDTRTFSSAQLEMGRGNSGKLVTAVKTALTDAAPTADLLIIDGSPGIGCPVMASMAGVDLVLVVAEPSQSGISDMKRILQTAQLSCLPTAVCVNKYNLHPQSTAQIQAYCTAQNIPFVGTIPYDRTASVAINQGQSLAQIDCPATTALQVVYRNTMDILQI